MKFNSKTIARVSAIQALYQYNENPNKNYLEIIKEIKEFYKDNSVLEEFEVDPEIKTTIKPSKQHLNELVKFTVENLQEIDNILDGHLNSKWTLKNLPVLLLALMRVAIAEIKFFPEIPRKVVVNEYATIASEMVGDNETGFVNSVLDITAKNTNK